MPDAWHAVEFVEFISAMIRAREPTVPATHNPNWIK
jgi:hypothetical protein